VKKPDPHREARLRQLCARFDYEFRDLGLLNLALSHSSLGNEGLPNYERLEFLGDSVLGFLVAESLYLRKPEIPEGELTARRSLVVSRAPLAQVAADLRLNDYVLVGRGLSEDARRSRRIMADLTEAVIGAIYLDGGVVVARRFVQTFVLDRFADTQEVRSITDAKTRLNQWAQSEGMGTPEYAIVECSGPDHDPTFKVAVSLGELTEVSGAVKNKQAGEQQAAAKAHARLVARERAAALDGADREATPDPAAVDPGETGAGVEDPDDASDGEEIQIVW
jgi:ribonuclease-3